MNNLVYDFDLLDFGKDHDGRSWIEALRVDSRYLLSPLGAFSLNELLLDLLDVAVAVYTADRVCRRSPGRRTDREDLIQSRELNLRIPLRKPKPWSESKVYEKLIATLEYLTLDNWNIDFYQSNNSLHGGVQVGAFREVMENSSVGLFSGGLDSLAGAAIAGVGDPDAKKILLIGSTNARLKQIQGELVNALNRAAVGSYIPVVVPHSFDSFTNFKFPERTKQEKSQRTRGFLYPVMGAVLATLLKKNSLQVYENGVGALNLPYTRATIGAEHTRAMHPKHLLNLSDFLSVFLEETFTIENPSMWQTKGMMCRELNHIGLGELALHSVSCDSFPLRNEFSQCGRCTSCLLRRMSLAVGGLLKLEQRKKYYKHDIFALTPSNDKENLYPLRFMLAQVEKMQFCLDGDNPTKALFKAFPELLDARISLSASERCNVGAVDVRLLKLFDNYVKEWEWFAEEVPAARGLLNKGGEEWRN